MFIQTEATPNPNALKFLPGIEISPGYPTHFDKKEEASKSPLARKLFSIDGVDAVFFGVDFITITKSNDFSWEILKPELLINIMDHLSAKLPIFDEESSKKESSNIDPSLLSDIEKQIVEIIETRVRPSVAMDGGDITFRGFKDGIVTLQLKGACSGCPSSAITLKSGIESMLKHFVPEVESVEAIDESEE
jgi:Fe-S cluster biogenesis protein NfuA